MTETTPENQPGNDYTSKLERKIAKGKSIEDATNEILREIDASDPTPDGRAKASLDLLAAAKRLKEKE